jgi:hypothetical protein
MKKIILAFFLFASLGAFSQGIEKNFLCILDEYIKHEPIQKSFNKDSIIVTINISELNKGYAINLQIFELCYFPISDTLKMYNGVRMVVKCPVTIKDEIYKNFKIVNEFRKQKELKEDDIYTIHESTSNCLFQINDKNEFYIISTPDDRYYHKRLKKRKSKFSKDLMFSEDLMFPSSAKSSR